MRKLLLYFLFVGFKSCAQDVSMIPLKTLNGENTSLHEMKKSRAIVVVFLLAGCPACENYVLTLNNMNTKYQPFGISFYGVFPGVYSKLNEIINYRDTYKPNFTLLLDKDKLLVKFLGAKVAPQVFVLNKQRQIVYRGRIDDWMYAVGKKRAVITHHELEDALNAVVKGEKITTTLSIPVGCLIE